MILLFHEDTTDGMIATEAAPVAGDYLSPRQYTHEGHYVVIDGPDHVVVNDADQICKIPGYRMATPEESDTYYSSKKKKTAVREQLPQQLQQQGDK